MGSFLKGLARMFTIPRAVRQKLNANPLAPVVKTALANELSTVINTTVSQHVSDPQAAAAITAGIGHAVDSTGIFD